jgi:hypothetical protein
MSALHKHQHTTGAGDGTEGCADAPEEAFAYEEDVSAAALEILRQKAEKIISNKKWNVIDGYVPEQRTGVDK